MEVGNETWTLGTTLKIKRGATPPTAGNTTPTGSDRGSAETLESKENAVDPDEALRFLFKAIDHFGKNTEVIKQVSEKVIGV